MRAIVRYEYCILLIMKSLVFGFLIIASSCTTALAQSVVEPAPKYPMCIYGNRAKGIQKTFPCRVITDGRTEEVIFIDEYAGRSKNSRFIARHDGNQGWYAPVVMKSECLLRGQGVEYICIGKPWKGV